MRCTKQCMLFAFALIALVAALVLEFLQPWHKFMNDSNNFLWYHRLGNVGFVGFSGAASWEHTRRHLEDACTFFGDEPDLAAIILMGHWDVPGMGCSKDMA